MVRMLDFRCRVFLTRFPLGLPCLLLASGFRDTGQAGASTSFMNARSSAAFMPSWRARL